MRHILLLLFTALALGGCASSPKPMSEYEQKRLDAVQQAASRPFIKLECEGDSGCNFKKFEVYQPVDPAALAAALRREREKNFGDYALDFAKLAVPLAGIAADVKKHSDSQRYNAETTQRLYDLLMSQDDAAPVNNVSIVRDSYNETTDNSVETTDNSTWTNNGRIDSPDDYTHPPTDPVVVTQPEPIVVMPPEPVIVEPSYPPTTEAGS